MGRGPQKTSSEQPSLDAPGAGTFEAGSHSPGGRRVKGYTQPLLWQWNHYSVVEDPATPARSASLRTGPNRNMSALSGHVEGYCAPALVMQLEMRPM